MAFIVEWTQFWKVRGNKAFNQGLESEYLQHLKIQEFDEPNSVNNNISSIEGISDPIIHSENQIAGGSDNAKNQVKLGETSDTKQDDTSKIAWQYRLLTKMSNCVDYSYLYLIIYIYHTILWILPGSLNHEP